MDRKSYIKQNLYLEGFGLEIGPAHSPICPKREGYNIEILDCMSRAQLVKNYDNHPDKDKIEEVDFVWSGENYAKLIGKRLCYDYIIASHVIEHMVDLIVFFNDCSEILKNNGIISLAIPDKRYEFDYFRECASIKTVIDTYEAKRKRHSLGTILDSKFNEAVFIKSGNPSVPYYANLLEEYFVAEKKIDEYLELLKTYNNKPEYYNCHAWAFTPASFQILVYELYYLGYTDLEVISIRTIPKRLEFFVQLKKANKEKIFDKNKLLKLHLERRKEEQFIETSDLIQKMELCRKLNYRIYVYGTGEYANYITILLEKYNFLIQGYIVSDGRKKENMFGDKPIFELSELHLDNNKDAVFIGVSALYEDEIRNNLECIGFSNCFG